jgi:serine/threonine-protein kinase HipA
MTRSVEVHLGETPQRVGTLHYNQDGTRESAPFEYAASWLHSPDGFAIDPALPLVQGPQFHRVSRGGSVFHGAIADTEPDGWARKVILRDQAKRRAAARAAGDAVPPVEGALDFLLAVDDASRMGALRFRDQTGAFCRATEPGRRSAPPLLELADLVRATRAVEMNTETAADLAYLRGRGTSLGGLRPKCSIRDEDGSLAVGKFPSVADTRAVTKGEVLALMLARRAGIRAAHARLVWSEDVPVTVIRRFDRDGEKRLMYVSAATLLGIGRDDERDHSYTELVDALRQHGAHVRADTEEIWRRIAFSVLITNVDDHLWNHGFLHVEAGQWHLSPAFDVNPFPDRERALKTWISEETGPAATIEALLSVIPYFRIPPARARAILGKVERAVARWREVGVEIGMTPDELEAFADAFEHPEREAAHREASSARRRKRP